MPLARRAQELHRDRARLERARVVKEAEMEEHRARCQEIQMLKFGRLINLEMVDKVTGGEAGARGPPSSRSEHPARAASGDKLGASFPATGFPSPCSSYQR